MKEYTYDNTYFKTKQNNSIYCITCLLYPSFLAPYQCINDSLLLFLFYNYQQSAIVVY